jgi:hypothetical protein
MRDTQFIHLCAVVLAATNSVAIWSGSLAGPLERYRRRHRERRDRADLAAMSDIERQDIGLPAFSAWR